MPGPSRRCDGTDGEAEGQLVDRFDREVTGLRLSLTDRCNLDCTYCHNEGLGDAVCGGPDETEMSVADVRRITATAHDFGVRRFKLTGGEPMLRRDLEQIVGAVARLPDAEVSLTTNGHGLAARADDLAARGLDRVNVSMDTPDSEAFGRITGGSLERVRRGVAAAVDAELTPVKLNMVMTAETRPHLDGMIDLAAGHDGVALQLIEYMPELVGDQCDPADIEAVKTDLERRCEAHGTREMHDRDRYRVDGAVVEVVDPVGNESFCENCHRLRVTPEGDLKACLNRPDAVVPTDGAADDDLAARFERVTAMRVPYYGEYVVRDDDGDWARNPRYGSGRAATDGGSGE